MPDVASTFLLVGVQTTFENAMKAAKQPIPSHPLAVSAVAGSFGPWQVRRHAGSPLGYVLHNLRDHRWVFDVYAHCRDDGGARPWLRTFDSLNAAVAWMIQHERQIREFNAQHHPEPKQWQR